MGEVWTEQDEQQLKALRRRKKAWLITQQGRKRKFGPKKYGNSPKFLKRFNCERCGKKLTKEEHEIDTGNLCEYCRKYQKDQRELLKKLKANQLNLTHKSEGKEE